MPKPVTRAWFSRFTRISSITTPKRNCHVNEFCKGSASVSAIYLQDFITSMLITDGFVLGTSRFPRYFDFVKKVNKYQEYI